MVQTKDEAAVEYTIKVFGLELLKSAEEGFKKLDDASRKLGENLLGADSFGGIFKNLLSDSKNLTLLAKATGYSTDALQKWQYAATKSGVSADAIMSDMQSLKTNYAMGEKDLIRLAGTFQKSSTFYAQQLGNYLGMSQDMINLLRQGPNAIREYMDEAERLGAVIPSEEIEKAAKLQADWQAQLQAFSKVAQQIAGQILPKLTEWLGKLNKFSQEHPEKVFEYIKMAMAGMAGVSVFKQVASLITTFKELSNIGKPVVGGLELIAKTIDKIGTSAGFAEGSILKFAGQLSLATAAALALYEAGEPVGDWFYSKFNGDYQERNKLTPEQIQRGQEILRQQQQQNQNNTTNNNNNIVINVSNTDDIIPSASGFMEES